MVEATGIKLPRSAHHTTTAGARASRAARRIGAGSYGLREHREAIEAGEMAQPSLFEPVQVCSCFSKEGS